MTSADGAPCAPCAAGTAAEVAGSPYCSDCEEGKFASADGSVGCDRCAAGTSSLAGSATCAACPRGKSSEAGAASCSDCEAGKFAPCGIWRLASSDGGATWAVEATGDHNDPHVTENDGTTYPWGFSDSRKHAEMEAAGAEAVKLGPAEV